MQHQPKMPNRFVQVGDHVNKGDTLCIVESMKLMNEIVAENDGVIEQVVRPTVNSSNTALSFSV